MESLATATLKFYETLSVSYDIIKKFIVLSCRIVRTKNYPDRA